MKAQHEDKSEEEPRPQILEQEDTDEGSDKEKASKLSRSLIQERFGKGESNSGFTTRHGVTAGKDLNNPALEKQRPTSGEVTVISYVAGKYNQLFSEIRTGSTIRNRIRTEVQQSTFMKGLPSWLKNSKLLKSAFRAPKTSEEIKKKAKRLIEKQSKTEQTGLDENKDDEVKKLRWIQRSVAHVDAVGHAWVKLRGRVGKKTKELSSFGMHADDDENYKDPRSSVPGKVEYPDAFTEGLSGGQVLSRTYKVSRNNYLDAFDFAAKTHSAPPPYSMIGYHCTTFVRDVAAAAGVPFKVKKYAPKGVSKLAMFGLGLAKKLGFTKDASPDTISPTGLYESLQKDSKAKDVREEEKEDDAERQQIKEELELEAQREARRTSVLLFAGSQDKKARYIIPPEEFDFLSKADEDKSQGDMINIRYVGSQHFNRYEDWYVSYPDLVNVLGADAARKLRPDYDPSKEKKSESKSKSVDSDSSRDMSPISELALCVFPDSDAMLTIDKKEKANLSKSSMAMAVGGWVSICYTGPKTNQSETDLFVRQTDLQRFVGRERAKELFPA